MKQIIQKLSVSHSLTLEEYEELLENYSAKNAALLKDLAAKARREIYGNEVYVRGLIEISNYCRGNCLYCGIRADNAGADRYRLTPDEILASADKGYELGFRTFVLQGGEDPFFSDKVMCDLIGRIKDAHPDCAITLSLGERTKDSYQAMYHAGADRYLLREETADPHYYPYLHPKAMSWENRMQCLRDLRDIGYAVGCGFLVQAPGQIPRHLAADLKWIETFRPDMCGIGPFIPQKDTPFAGYPAGTLEMTCYLISILRLIDPCLLLPATTALGTIHPMGRELGIQAGANVVMPNLTPVGVREKYALYDHKICTGEEAAECKHCLERRMESIGYRIVTSRGDKKKADK